MLDATSITLRPAASDEDRVARRLAALDSAPPLRGPVLLALADGEPVAALSLADGRAVADPFRPSAEAVALLRAHVGAGQGRDRRRPVGRKALHPIHV
ncbi:MAG TPA: hypothetical protein VLA98_10500 [Solirubrobacteraceae bacterium]|nr:hypothetical protein [Solirubrobacteraceae bacterium]HSD79064.1 hypothetical protein [Solirubrobacteraceae bacterium]